MDKAIALALQKMLLVMAIMLLSFYGYKVIKKKIDSSFYRVCLYAMWTLIVLFVWGSLRIGLPSRRYNTSRPAPHSAERASVNQARLTPPLPELTDAATPSRLRNKNNTNELKVADDKTARPTISPDKDEQWVPSPNAVVADSNRSGLSSFAGELPPFSASNPFRVLRDAPEKRTLTPTATELFSQGNTVSLNLDGVVVNVPIFNGFTRMEEEPTAGVTRITHAKEMGNPVDRIILLNLDVYDVYRSKLISDDEFYKIRTKELENLNDIIAGNGKAKAFGIDVASYGFYAPSSSIHPDGYMVQNSQAILVVNVKNKIITLTVATFGNNLLDSWLETTMETAIIWRDAILAANQD